MMSFGVSLVWEVRDGNKLGMTYAGYNREREREGGRERAVAMFISKYTRPYLIVETHFWSILKRREEGEGVSFFYLSPLLKYFVYFFLFSVCVRFHHINRRCFFFLLVFSLSLASSLFLCPPTYKHHSTVLYILPTNLHFQEIKCHFRFA